MSGYIGDLSTYFGNGVAASAYKSNAMDSYGLNMDDFLSLMVAQFTNQSMDNTADTGEMLNQLVQMQMVTALANMTDASIMTYAASLVGKEVTVGGVDGNGDYVEVVGTVTGTGSYGSDQVVFVDGVMYYMSEILAVGRLPSVGDADNVEPGTGENGSQNQENADGDNLDGEEN